MTKERLHELALLDISVDEILELFPREELLSALGFDRASDHLDEVGIVDAVNYFGERELIEFFDITDYWDAEDAYDRYGSELLEYFSAYDNTSDWSAADHIDRYGDSAYMLEVLLEHYITHEELYIAIMNLKATEVDKLAQALGARKSVRSLLVDMLKAQREVLIDEQKDSLL